MAPAGELSQRRLIYSSAPVSANAHSSFGPNSRVRKRKVKRVRRPSKARKSGAERLTNLTVACSFHEHGETTRANWVTCRYSPGAIDDSEIPSITPFFFTDIVPSPRPHVIQPC